MRTTCMKAFILALLIAGLGIQSAKAGSILRIFYDGIPGTAVANLVNATNSAGQPVFPNGPNVDGSPLQSEFITDVFEGKPPRNSVGVENYGSMMQGFLEAPQTGSYVFWISSDDASELWLGTNYLSSGKRKIASATSATGYRNWSAQASQKSAPIDLVKGEKYYIQVLHKEGTGNDYVSVGWQLPDGTIQQPMPMYYVQMYPVGFYADPSILQQPVSTNVIESRMVNLFVNVSATPPVSYQWFKNGQPIPGAVLSSYSFMAGLADSGARFNVQVSGKSGVLVSRQAQVMVSPDEVAPALVSASSIGDPNTVTVSFSEALSTITGLNPDNYALDNGAEIFAVLPGSDAKTVLLATTPLDSKKVYNLTVSGVQDLASTPNTITPSSITFPVVGGYVQYKLYTGISGTSTNDIPNNAKYKSGVADMTGISSSFETPWSLADNYIGQLQAWLTPPVSGDYSFSVFGDDGTILYLSTDENPANKKAIAVVASWSNSKQYTKEAGQKSAPVTLEANKRYYIEAVVKEGSGGDGVGAGWQMPGAAALKDNDPAIPGQYLTAIKTFGPVVITNQLKSVSVGEAKPVTFTIGADGVDGLPPYYYQWYKNGQMISGATSSSYSISKVGNADNQGVYTVLVRNNFSITASSNAVLTVIPDTVAPTAVAAGITNGVVSVTFNEPVTSDTATNAANYSLKSASGSAVTITGVTLLDSSNVQLSAAGLTVGSAYNLTISGVKDQSEAGNTMAATTVPVAVYNFTGVQRINNTQAYGVVPAANGALEITAGGSDIWNTADQFVFAYTQTKGNFDYRVRVQSMTLADPWSKAGIMVRSSLSAGSANLMLAATPQGSSGLNSGTGLYSYQYRDTENASSGSYGTPRPGTTYPNVWSRIQRVGNIFTAYYSTNGTDWIKIEQRDTSANALPDSLYVGVAVTSHTTSAITKAVISDYGQVPIVAPTFSLDLANLTIDEMKTATFKVTVTGSGPFTYQWQRNGTAIAGATNASYTTLRLSKTESGAKYRVVVTNPYGTSITSKEATLTVTPDVTAPSIVAGGIIEGSSDITLKFNEELDSVLAQNVANYSVVGFAGTVTGASVRPDNQTVALKVSEPITDDVSVVVKAISDLSGNMTRLTNNPVLIPMISQDIGTVNTNGVFTDPVQPGTVYATTAADFETIAGGSDIWNNSDGFRFVYNEVKGDFDVRVRVESLQYVTDNWAKAGLMVRESTAGGSRNLNAVVDPAAGANVWEFNYRATTGGASAGIPGASAIGPVTYPNAWIRIMRQGDTFTIFRSSDGVAWEQRAQITPDPVYPETVLVGMATTAHNNTAGKSTVAVYRNFKLGPLAYPGVEKAVGSSTMNQITLTFTEPLQLASATNVNNYSVSGGLTVEKAVLDATGTKVTLTTSTQNPGELYTVTVNNVKSTSGLPVEQDTRASFSGWVLSRGVVTREVWNGIANPLTNLKASPKYPNSPDTVGYLSKFEAPTDVADNYSQRVWAYLLPPVTGDYTFHIASDDQSELYLSTDENPANKKLIASVSNWTSSREYTAPTDRNESNQHSAAIHLEANKPYYIEALMSEGGGGDNLAVAWMLPGQTGVPANGSEPISGLYLANFANPDLAVLSIDQQPADVTVQTGRSATMSVQVYSAIASTPNSAVLYQWQKLAPNSTTWVDVAGANNASYASPLLTTADSGTRYRVAVYMPGASMMSDEAVVTVIPDTEAPKMESAATFAGSKTITVKYNEVMSASAGSMDHYVVFGGPVVVGSTLRPDGTTLVLTVDRAITNQVVVYAENVLDLAGNSASLLAIVRLSTLQARDVGTQDASGNFTDPVQPGRAMVLGLNKFEIEAGGSDIWNNSDGFHFVYKEVTGDFDVKVRMEDVRYVSDNWAKGGLMVRESLAGNSRDLNCVVDPTKGANVWEFNYRASTGGASAGIPNSSAVGPVTYPNAWIRFNRKGNTFTIYRSSNGTDWEQRAQIAPDPAYPATVYAGMVATAHNNTKGTNTVAKFSDFLLTQP